MLVDILIVVYALSAIYQLFYWYQINQIQFSISPGANPVKSPSVSVVIAAKNEANNLSQYLPLILAQDYKNFEIIVVDDGSTDDTLDVLQQLHCDYLKVISIPHQGKKAAMTKGIISAQGDWILATDADCRPKSAQWIKTMMHNHQDRDVILGYGPYEGSTSWPVDFLRYETWYIAIQYMLAAIKGNAYMGVGRNLAYRKSVFTEVNGYNDHQDVRSGDDDLFITQLSKQYRIRICVQPDSWMYSKTPNKWSQLWSQKRRHLTTAPKYRLDIQIQLMIKYLFQLFSYIVPIILVYQGMTWALSLILIRWIVMLMFSRRWMKALGVGDLWFKLPLMDATMVGYYTLQGLVMPWQKKGW